MGESASLRILIVDDDPSFVKLLTKVLEHRGHRVSSMPGALGLVSRVSGTEAPSPDVVVLDCAMPALPGPVALGFLARSPRASLVPVLLVSAAPNEEAENAAEAHPRATFRVKDGHLFALADAVEARARASDGPISDGGTDDAAFHLPPSESRPTKA